MYFDFLFLNCNKSDYYCNSTLHLHIFAGDLQLLALKHQAEENYSFLVDEKLWYYLQNTSVNA